MIKSKNIFERFCKDVYTIKYQKRGFPHIYLLIFLYSANQFLQISQINKIIYTKLLIVKTNPIRDLTRTITLVLLYFPYNNINFYSSYIRNTQKGLPKCTNHYLRNFFKESSIQENSYLFYWQCNNSFTYAIPHPQD